MGESDDFVEELRKYVKEKGYEFVEVSYAQPNGSWGITVEGHWYNLERDYGLVSIAEYEQIIDDVTKIKELKSESNHFPHGNRRFHITIKSFEEGIQAIEKIANADMLVNKVENALANEREEHIRDLVSKLG